MTDENKPLVKREYFPLSQGIAVQLLSDVTHKRYSLEFDGLDALLFDNMHVDTVFHDEKDPLHEYYPNVEEIVSDLTDNRFLKNLETAVRYMNEFNKIYGQMLNGLKEYAKTPKGMPRKFFADFAQTIRKNMWSDQIQYMTMAKDVVEKQLKFLSEIKEKHPNLEQAISVYESLQEALSDNIAGAQKVIKKYGEVVRSLYEEEQPPQIFGKPPTYTEKEKSMNAIAFTMLLVSRPALQIKLKKETHRRIRETLDGIRSIADQARLELSKQGHYSTRPDLR